ncbi:MAG: hypothetical protein RIQ68_981 [Pseudomonadota bacterium]|jgi:hypothetical protein
MKKPKKHLKTLARLGAYLKKEATKLEKIIARSGESEGSALVDGILRRMTERRAVALADLGLVDAADEAARQAVKSARAKKASAKKSGKASVKKVTKKAPKKAAKPSRKPAAKPARKAAAKKAAPARRRVAKAASSPEA